LDTNLHADLIFARISNDATRNDVKLIADQGASVERISTQKAQLYLPAPADFPPRTIRRLEHYSEAIRTMGRENQYHPGTSEGATAGFDIWCRVKNRKVRPFK
jgi:hypothetical protein